MKKLAAKLWAVLMLMLVSMQTMATDVYTSNRTDFRDESIYFMMTTRFYDGDPSNNVLCWDNQEAQKSTKDPCWRGDFQGVIDKLDYIKALGFTAIWITPVVQNASGYDYHGYHASDFSKVDCRYQSGDGKKSGDVMFQELIDKAHAKGIKIILDIVLNHTGNFGEEHFCKEFDRDTRLRNQADINACMIPNLETLGSDYPGLLPGYQYQRRLAMMKNTDGQNHDTHNYWHHFGNFNWDLPNRWWAQIAGDCVDLNTENNTVADYLVKCYGNFIKMGVDGFRIDTSGHISRLTFCKQFIPQFAALGKQYEDKRLNKAPFFMYGEVCARFGSVQYRNQDNLSPYYYTWKAPKDLMDGFDGSQSYWDTQEIYDSGTGYDAKLMPLCEKDNANSPESNNTFMLNGAWHEPDYSQSSGFNVIDFPLHYNFSNAGSAYGLAKSGDMKYNDATFNVVYVDSHDYGPQPSDGIRFSGSDAQWAENLSLMFTFRGIPCLYYGSEVGFRRGSVIDKGPNGPLSNTGRAYFGGYITGDVEASDFGEYKASGNVEATLNHDLAQHLIRLNKIRQAVPALRKGQWTDEGCAANGGIAFKRAYKDSYALVALNGGATFTGCPAGTYTDLVTGKTYTGSTITVDAPSNQGQVRVLVKDWKGGKLIDDGAFIYASAAQHKSGQDYDGNQEAGTTWVDETPLQPVSVSLSPAGGSFRTNTVTVTATLSEDALSGWYQIEGQDKVDLTPGKPATFTIGDDMNFNQTKTVTWSATSSEGEKTGKVTYTKVDPNAAITVYVKADKAPYIHAWTTTGPNAGDLTGKWPGKVMDGPVEIDGAKYWTYDFDNVESFNVILNNGSGAQSGKFEGITGDIYLEYDGSTSAKKIDAPVNTVATAKVTLSPNGGDFQKTISVTATLSNNAKSGWYKIGDGEQVALTPGKVATFTLGEDMLEGESKTVTWSATNADNETKTGSATFNKIKEVVIPTPTGIFAYFLAPAEWSDIHVWAWNDTDNFTGGNWPGVACTKTGAKKNGLDVWMWKYDGDLTGAPTNIIFNNNGNGANQTETFAFVNGAVYNRSGKTNENVSTGINQTVAAQKAPAKLKIYSINGVKVAEVNKVSDAEYVLAPGMYICNGKKFVIK
ncbi:alpha-amylase family glycosyl hydrolase [Segatella sp.]|uniref:alpha-amylase family glycosyl hydrolase n=1 Tax=Segatella sp. TaxID=2974253 RepID=UPI003AB91A32